MNYEGTAIVEGEDDKCFVVYEGADLRTIKETLKTIHQDSVKKFINDAIKGVKTDNQPS